MCLFRATPVAYGIFQARDWIEAKSVTYTTAHGNTGFLTHWARPGIEPASSWILVRFITTELRQKLLSTFNPFPLLLLYMTSRKCSCEDEPALGPFCLPLSQESCHSWWRQASWTFSSACRGRHKNWAGFSFSWWQICTDLGYSGLPTLSLLCLKMSLAPATDQLNSCDHVNLLANAFRMGVLHQKLDFQLLLLLPSASHAVWAEP